eukprot:1158512-Pelagomonas_calceolata.AAC.9
MGGRAACRPRERSRGTSAASKAGARMTAASKTGAQTTWHAQEGHARPFSYNILSHPNPGSEMQGLQAAWTFALYFFLSPLLLDCLHILII